MLHAKVIDVTKEKIIKETRGWERPSDHVPIVINLDLK